jgi:hypothetical protein
MTILRIWRSVTLAAKAEQYVEYLNRIVIPAYQTAEGNKGLFIMKQLQGELAHFLLLSFWTSDKTFERSAGADTCTCEVVNPSPEEKSLLIAFESIARHYEVVYMSESSPLDKNKL